MRKSEATWFLRDQNHLKTLQAGDGAKLVFDFLLPLFYPNLKPNILLHFIIAYNFC